MSDPTSAAVSKQTEYLVERPGNSVSKQTEYVAMRPILGLSKQTEYIAQIPLQAISRQVEYIISLPVSNIYTHTIDENGDIVDFANIPQGYSFEIQEYGLIADDVETTTDGPDQFLVAGALRLLPDFYAWDAKNEYRSYMIDLVSAFTQTSIELYYAATLAPADIFPQTTVSLIPEWQETLGLPDPLVPVNGIANQQNQIVARLTGTGGASIPYFQNFIATLLGILPSQVQITEFYPFLVNHSRVWVDTLYSESAAFTWLITIPAGYDTALVTAEVSRIYPDHTVFSVVNA